MFCSKWELFAPWQHVSSILELKEYLELKQYKLNNLYNIDKETTFDDYLREEREYPFVAKRRNGEIEAWIHRKPNSDSEAFERLRQIFIWYYLFPIREDSPRMKILEATLQLIKEHKIRTFIYITPINFEKGSYYVGNNFLNIFKEKVTEIKRLILSSDLQDMLYKDYSTLLSTNNFYDYFEHLNYIGREKLAKEITNDFLMFVNKK